MDFKLVAPIARATSSTTFPPSWDVPVVLNNANKANAANARFNIVPPLTHRMEFLLSPLCPQKLTYEDISSGRRANARPAATRENSEIWIIPAVTQPLWLASQPIKYPAKAEDT